MVFIEGGTLAKARHIGTQVIDPDILRTVLFLIFIRLGAFGEKQYVGFHALGIKNPGG